ncbi:hypothetical protein M8494_16365 [Serratia ureilytica]
MMRIPVTLLRSAIHQDVAVARITYDSEQVASSSSSALVTVWCAKGPRSVACSS